MSDTNQHSSPRLSADETERIRRTPGRSGHPLCGIVIGSSWHEPVACAYPPGHTGDHSWATIPQFDPRDELSVLRERDYWSSQTISEQEEKLRRLEEQLEDLREKLAIEEQERADFEASQARLLEQLEATRESVVIAKEMRDDALARLRQLEEEVAIVVQEREQAIEAFNIVAAKCDGFEKERDSWEKVVREYETALADRGAL